MENEKKKSKESSSETNSIIQLINLSFSHFSSDNFLLNVQTKEAERENHAVEKCLIYFHIRGKNTQKKVCARSRRQTKIKEKEKKYLGGKTNVSFDYV